MTAYYNEIDPYAAQWLRNLIAAGHIAPGDVDERSIEDVHPDDLRPYTQCHFFAGIGVWSAALRGIGWPDDRRIWSGSCPCQPFSPAGKGMGFDDERHLWPAFFHLIVQCRPPVIVGEQVADRGGLAWLDLVQADMEATDHAFAAVDICAAGVGAPHIRQRLYWVANANDGGRTQGWEGAKSGLPDTHGPLGGVANTDMPGASRQRKIGGDATGAPNLDEPGRHGRGEWMGDAQRTGLEGRREGLGPPSGRNGAFRPIAPPSEFGGMAHPAGNAGPQERPSHDPEHGQWPEDGRGPIVTAGVGTNGGNRHGDSGPGCGEIGAPVDVAGVGGPGPTNGRWAGVDWLYCRDGKWRPVEPGTFPLAHGAPSRVGRLRAYGNAINLAQAETFLAAALT